VNKMGFWRSPDIAPASDVPEQQSAPVIVWVVVIASLISNLTGDTILGFQISGFGWLIPLVFSLYALFMTPGRPSLPYWIWMPWFALTIAYLLFTGAEHALQRTVMLLAPMVVGMAVSKAPIGRAELSHIESILDKFSLAFFVVILVNSGLALTGVLPEVTGLAPQATTAALFGTLFAAKYALGNKRAALKWLLFAAVPVIAVTRTGIIAAGLTFPLTFGPLPLWKRIVILIAVAALGFLVFNTERVQNKMFYSGEGTVFDLSLDNPDFKTSGRTFIQDAMQDEIMDSPWFGYGANASEQFVVDLTGGLTHPHNDYLRLAFDYGYVGTFAFLACMILQALHALRASYRAASAERLFLLAGAGAFIPFALFMATDNIVLYAAFFGNLHFMILGAGYAALANEERLPDSAGIGFQ
jgi:O-antigen ligase